MTVTCLPFSSSTLSPSASAYLRPSWKMWPISMPRASSSGTGAVGRRVAGAHLGGLDGAVGAEVAAGDEVEDVLAGHVGAGDPARCRRRRAGRAGTGCSAPSRRASRVQRRRADVALDSCRVLRRSPPRSTASTSAGADAASSALEVDLAVAGQADDDELARRRRVREREHDVLQRVGRGPRAGRLARGSAALAAVDERVDGRGVRGVLDVRGRARRRTGSAAGDHGRDRLDVGRVAAGRAHEGVLADRGRVQELLALRAAHRAGHRRDDDVLEAEPVEDAHVGVALRRVGGVQAGVVDVEGVGVLHRELAAAEQAGAGPRLVAVLGLDLVERERQVLVRRVEVLHQSVNISSCVGPSR